MIQNKEKIADYFVFFVFVKKKKLFAESTEGRTGGGHPLFSLMMTLTVLEAEGAGQADLDGVGFLSRCYQTLQRECAVGAL